MLVVVLLAGCEREAPTPPSPGQTLEAAAVRAGIVVDPATAPLAGSWARESGRVCVVPGTGGGEMRIGALVDYGEGQGCAASGTLTRRGETLKVRFGDCRFDARFDGERIGFPAELPAECQSLCTGRASLDALEVDRLSSSVSEAATLRTPSGRSLCAR